MRILVSILLSCCVAPAFAQMAPADTGMLLPLQDRQGDADLAQFVTEMLETEFRDSLRLASSDGLRDELRRLRLRNAGDIDTADLRLLAETFDVEWLISATLHFATDAPEPQIVVSAWAHRVEENNLAWAGFESGAGLTSERSLGRDRIEIIEDLAAVVVRRLVADFEDSLEGDREPIARVQPDRGGFLLKPVAVEQLGTVAVLPFESVTDVRSAESGELITALGRALLHRNGATVLHPGRVNAILRRRGVFMRGELDPLARAALRMGGDAGHILTGTVEIYEAPAAIEPNPHVAFSARLLEVDTGRIVWISGQERKGWDRPGLFGRDRIYDAGSLAENIMQSLVTGLLQPTKR